MRWRSDFTSHLPEGIPLRGEQAEILLSQLDRRQGLHLQISPSLDEHQQALKGVQAEAVVPIVGQVGHEDADLCVEETSRENIMVYDIKDEQYTQWLLRYMRYDMNFSRPNTTCSSGVQENYE